MTAFLAGQRRVLTDRCGLTDPGDMADAIQRGSYATFAAALAAGDPLAVIETVKAARLQGRGGAYFPAAVKWEGARRAAGEPKYLIVNGEEGEPGIFKDRHLLEGDPHRLLEGALLAAYAAGVSHIYLYIHGEADLAARRLERALDAARRWGLVSRHVLGSDFSVEVEIRRGAGGFVLGEETALMESLEGRRAMPRAKPPFPVEAGLWGRPTVINNVETLFAVPLIVAQGAAWWTGLGGGHGTKCFGLSGHVRRPGFVELPLGATLRDLLEGLGGGPAEGHTLQAVLVGGPSGSLVPPRLLDEPLVPGGARESGHRRHHRARRARLAPRRRGHAAGLQRPRVLRQVHPVSRGHGAASRAAEWPATGGGRRGDRARRGGPAGLALRLGPGRPAVDSLGFPGLSLRVPRPELEGVTFSQGGRVRGRTVYHGTSGSPAARTTDGWDREWPSHSA